MNAKPYEYISDSSAVLNFASNTGSLTLITFFSSTSRDISCMGSISATFNAESLITERATDI